MAMLLPEDFKEFLKLLNENRIDALFYQNFIRLSSLVS